MFVLSKWATGLCGKHQFFHFYSTIRRNPSILVRWCRHGHLSQVNPNRKTLTATTGKKDGPILRRRSGDVRSCGSNRPRDDNPRLSGEHTADKLIGSNDFLSLRLCNWASCRVFDRNVRTTSSDGRVGSESRKKVARGGTIVCEV